jgi:hypothetical protein
MIQYIPPFIATLTVRYSEHGHSFESRAVGGDDASGVEIVIAQRGYAHKDLRKVMIKRMVT